MGEYSDTSHFIRIRTNIIRLYSFVNNQFDGRTWNIFQFFKCLRIVKCSRHENIYTTQELNTVFLCKPSFGIVLKILEICNKNISHIKMSVFLLPSWTKALLSCTLFLVFQVTLSSEIISTLGTGSNPLLHNLIPSSPLSDSPRI